MKLLPILLGALLLISPVTAHNSDSKISLVIEFPDGRVLWSSGIGDYENLTKEMCEENDLSVRINGTTAEIDGYPLHLYYWNNGWYRGNAGNILAWADGTPKATPKNPYPRFSPSSETTYYSGGNEEVWNYSVGSGPFGAIDSTVVGFHGMIFFESWNGFYAMSSNGSLLWKNESIKGLSSPVIYNGTIYVGSSNGYLYSLTPQGDVILRKKLSEAPGYTGLSSSPIAVNGTIYVGTFESNNRSGKLLALSAEGEEKWNVSLNSTEYYSSPAYYQGVIYVPLAGKFNSTTGTWYPDFGIMAVKEGKILWVFKTNSSVKCTPLIYHDSIYFTTIGGFLYKISLNGNQEWKLKIGYSTSSPNAYGGKIFVGSGSFSSGGIFYAIYENSTIAWSRNVSGGVQSSITIAPPFVLFSSNSQNGTVYCFDFNGREIWRFNTGNYLLSSPSIIDRSVYFGDDGGVIHKLSDSQGPKIQFQGEQFYKFGEGVNVTIRATDNIGVRNIWVSYENETLHGKSSINLRFRADFIGKKSIRAIAEDYNGNLREETFEISVYNETMKLTLTCPEKIEPNRVENCTVKITDEKGNLVDNASIVVLVDGNVTSRGKSVGGFYHFTLKLSPGNHTIEIIAEKYGFKEEKIERRVEVKNEEKEEVNYSFLWPIAVLVALLLIFSVIIAYLLNRKQEKYEEINRERMKNKK